MQVERPGLLDLPDYPQAKSLWWCCKYFGIFFAGTFIESCSWWPVYTSLYHQCWSSSGICFGANLIPGFYQWSSRWGSIKNRDLWKWHHTKTKLLSFSRRRYPLLVPVDMNGIELPEETRFHLLGLTFIRSMDWKAYIQSIAKAGSRKVDSLYRPCKYCIRHSFVHDFTLAHEIKFTI